MNAARGDAGFDLIRAVWSRRKWPAVLVFLSACSAALSLTMFLPNLYVASATVLVEGQQVPEAFVKSAVTNELETRLQTISQKSLSRARLEELIARFNLYPELREKVSLGAVVEQMRRDIKIELKEANQGGGRSATVAFTLSYRGREPQTVAEITNRLAAFYIDENLKQRERQATQTADFLWSQLQEVRERLLAMVAAPDAEKGAAGSEEDPIAARITKLNQELTELRTRFSEKYPDVIRIKAEIAALTRQLAPEPQPRHATARKKAPGDPGPDQPPAGGVRAEGPGSPGPSRDYKTTKELYDSLLKRYEDARIAEHMEQVRKGEEFQLLDAALAPEEPAAPKRMRLAVLGLMLSLGMAVGVVLLAEQMDASFHTIDDLRAFTTVPVLVGIPRIVTAVDRHAQRLRRSLAAVSALAGLALIIGSSYYVAHGNESLVWLLTQGRF